MAYVISLTEVASCRLEERALRNHFKFSFDKVKVKQPRLCILCNNVLT